MKPSIDEHRPDFWDGSQSMEFKRASGTQRGNYNQRSSYFPDVSFDVNVDETTICYPRPLLVMVFDAYSSSPKEITRRLFPKDLGDV